MKALSILIPVYNWNCSQLISDLHAQGNALGIPFEIIAADDHSTDTGTLNAVSSTAANLEHCRFIAIEQNIGRSAIRNLLADNASYERLLFMDCDAAVCSPAYLQDYIAIADNADVICGGLLHPANPPCDGVELRWKYEKKADKKRSAAYRSLTPYARFTPFNFMILRDVFQSIRFSTAFTGYGYEDVLFGMELEKRGISILHIDNPLIHLGIEDNATYMAKTEQAIRNLALHQDNLKGGSTLFLHYSRICSLHLAWLLTLSAKALIQPVRRNLLGANPDMKLFPLYKLLYLSLQISSLETAATHGAQMSHSYESNCHK